MSERNKRTLKEVLETKADSDEEVDTDLETHDEEMSDSQTGGTNAEESSDACCECGDQPKELICLNCDEEFCQVCFDYLHRTGKRKDHNVQYLVPITQIISEEEARKHQKDTGASGNNDETTKSIPAENRNENENENAPESEMPAETSNNAAHSNEKILKNAKFVPMRLSLEERKLFRLLDAALEVSEYTDRVDIYSFSSKAKRIVKELREICQVLIGLVVANGGAENGKELLENGEFSANAEWFQNIFEIGRRYKIMNPEEMRTNYGKMMYMIMDSRLPEIKQILDFDLYKPVLTVENFLSDLNALALLEDPLLSLATMEILQTPGKSRQQLNLESKRKHQAIDKLCLKYGENVRNAIYSLGDFHSYIASNQIPVEDMISRLRTQYDPVEVQTESFSLGISSGRNGARLTHNHRKQYQYVLQSLTLWSEIMGDTYLLWKFADDDLMSETYRYRLEDTGQGLNRVKASPKVNRLMHSIIARAQQNTGSWVGSSVVHLGDRAVPNAMFFLDKYLQVPRILNPVNSVIKQLPGILESDIFANEWAETQFGSVDVLLKTILTDFFRYAFDGSGADNFYDAGSCIDGRLTSAWNWTNVLPKKPYYKFFLITGFSGFDGVNGF